MAQVTIEPSALTGQEMCNSGSTLTIIPKVLPRYEYSCVDSATQEKDHDAKKHGADGNKQRATTRSVGEGSHSWWRNETWDGTEEAVQCRVARADGWRVGHLDSLAID